MQPSQKALHSSLKKKKKKDQMTFFATRFSRKPVGESLFCTPSAMFETMQKAA